MTAAEVKPERILRELSALWESLAKTPNPDGTTATLRACAMTLIVAPVADSEIEAVRESLANLMREYPSRAIVVRSVPGPSTLESRVFAQCWLPFWRRQQLCCEQIEISASADRVGDLHALLLPLVAPDLPAVLWFRGKDLFSLADGEPLLTLAGTLVLDTASLGEPGAALDRVHRVGQNVRRVADLAWTRLTPWRQAIAHVFETAACRANVPAIHRIRVQGGPTTGALYLAAWLRERIPGARLEVGAGAAATSLDSVSLEASDWRLSVGLSPCGLAVALNSTVSHVVLPDASDAALLAEELAILGRDPAFESTLPQAAALAAEVR